MLQPSPGLMRLLGKAGGNTAELAAQIMQRLQENALQVFPASQGSAHLQLSVAADCRDQVRPALGAECFAAFPRKCVMVAL